MVHDESFFLRFACLGMEDMRQIGSCNRTSGNFTKFTLASTVTTVKFESWKFKLCTFNPSSPIMEVEKMGVSPIAATFQTQPLSVLMIMGGKSITPQDLYMDRVGIGGELSW